MSVQPLNFYTGLLTAGYFARDISIHFDDLLERCRFREAGGAYEAVLDYCLEELKRDGEDVYHYVQVEELIGILQQEHYLILSEREQIREKYFLFRKEAGRLYNQYQTAIR